MTGKQTQTRKTKSGTVISNKMDKTVVVSVERTMQHQRYGKVIKRSQKYYAHTENDQLQIGDTVTISETRPYSKTKRWRVVEQVQG